MAKENNTKFMKRAIELAFKGYGMVSPNPMVGAVIVKDGRVIAEGHHKGAGLPHAEINALRAAGKKAKGADLYINLEPCCHFGRTPPCADALIKAGIKRLVYGMKDPNPLVAGKGLKRLKDGGIKVIGPVLEDVCKGLNHAFIKHMTTGLPYVTAKIAITLDGKIADFRGDSKWITNEASRAYVHTLRAGSDVVMVGANTAKKDRPRLNVRLPGYKGRQPVPIIVGPRKVDIKRLLKELGRAGFQSVLVEGGSELHSEMIKRRLIDEMVVFIAPKILGYHAKEWIGDIGMRKMKDLLNIKLTRSFMLGDNIVLEGRPVY